MTTWDTADSHFGYENIIKCCARPFTEREYALCSQNAHVSHHIPAGSCPAAARRCGKFEIQRH